MYRQKTIFVPECGMDEWLKQPSGPWLAQQKLLHPKPDDMDDHVYAYERFAAEQGQRQQQQPPPPTPTQNSVNYDGRPSSGQAYPSGYHYQQPEHTPPQRQQQPQHYSTYTPGVHAYSTAQGPAFDPYAGMTQHHSSIPPDPFYYATMPYTDPSTSQYPSAGVAGSSYSPHASSNSPYQQQQQSPSPYSAIPGTSNSAYGALPTSTTYGQHPQLPELYGSYEDGTDFGMEDAPNELYDYGLTVSRLGPRQEQDNMVIDPQLIVSSAQPDDTSYPQNPPSDSISPALIHPHPLNAAAAASLSSMASDANHRSYSLPTTSAAPQVTPTPTRRSSSSATSTARPRQEPKFTFLDTLQPEKLERIPVETAALLISFLTAKDAEPLDAKDRMQILQVLRDSAPMRFFEAWASEMRAIEVLREWLKEAIAEREKGGNKALMDTIMPLLHVIDRLPLDINHLKETKIGKLIRHLTKDSPSTAVKDMASKLEQRWRKMAVDQSDAGNGAGHPVSGETRKRQSPTDEDSRKKRKIADAAPVKAPVKKVAAPAPKAPAKPAKPPPPPPTVKTVTNAKADSSFFSSTKPKANKLPSFRKPAPEVKKETPSSEDKPNVAQPSAVDPFQEALRSMNKKSGADRSTPTVEVKPEPEVVEEKKPKKRKSVSFATGDALVKVKLIEPAVYDDDDETEHPHLNIRDLDRAEGRAFAHMDFEEQMDWFDPEEIEFPQEVPPPERGGKSDEKRVQEEREKSVKQLFFEGPAPIPDSPTEIEDILPEPPEDSKITPMVVSPGMRSVPPEDDGSAEPPNVADLLKKISGVALPESSSSSTNALAGYGIDPDMIARILAQANPGLGTPPPGQQVPQPDGFGVGASGDWQEPGPSWNGGYDGGGGGGGGGDGYRGRRGSGFRGENDQGWSGRGRGRARGRGRGDGPGRHEKRQRNIPCQYFQLGRCKYGEDCDYLHLGSFVQ